ncbi:type I restriction-modification system subunit M [Methylomonas sp. SURF-1]|uniref:site-specific DNA-methyltransferase (adenine-specific) n=1 Tax=Methylomonas aurea TaxID=2952224 RepID=A0ABT1UPD4_9GAMM|nr:class I SAM-dependent DNA methyltransferase [Methylomonas sp. SURF-1]MCQ8183693.1 type I restriction-modification system subunit M [Methylomonas sp. SURF-1]
MNGETHSQLANFIWSICNLLRGPYKRNEYRKVILPLTVLRRFDCLLAPTKNSAFEEFQTLKTKPERVIQARLQSITGHRFYNLSRMQFDKNADHSLLNDPNNLAPNLNSYINGFSPNVRAIMEKFKFSEQIAHMAEKNILFEVVKAFAAIDLSPQRVDNVQMGYVFEELIRIGAEQSNEEAGEHFTPREVIKLMVNLLLVPEQDLAQSHIVKTIYDPACGTGGMLSVAEEYIRKLNIDAQPKLFGQDFNDEAWAVCKSDMLIKGEDADNVILGDTFTRDGFDRDSDGNKWTFDYMLANPPFGVEWKQQQKYIQQEADTLGFAGRFGAGTPRINDGAFLFLQHMIAKMRPVAAGGSRIGIVFNGSPLFTGDAGSGESEIRRWIIENDWLEAIVALPEQLFYNTGISTYIWIISNRKEPQRKGKVQLIDARNFWVPMEKSLGNKRRRIGDPSDKAKDPNHIGEITQIYANFADGEPRSFTFDGKDKELVVSKVFDNEDFGYHKITVERPLRLNFQANAERIARLEEQTAFINLASSSKKNETVRQQEIEAGRVRQQQIRDLLATFAKQHGDTLFLDRKQFLLTLRDIDRAHDVRLSAPELKAVLAALSERDETANICTDRQGNPEPDADLRDTETVPLKESIDEYFKREVLPHVPDAWIDHSKTKIGYEIPLNRHFYRYEPPRELETIEAEIKALEGEIVDLLKEVTA